MSDHKTKAKILLVKQLLELCGEDPNREGLRDTPARVVKSWSELYGGYDVDPSKVLKTQFAESQKYDQMVVLRDIDFFSTCEHHCLPFFGKAHIAYLPDKAVVGISKLARLVDCFARRLQIQEVMTQQIADALEANLQPKGVAVVVIAQHFCMTSRGVRKQRAKMITSAVKGAMIQDQKTRMEFLQLCGVMQ